MPRWGQMMTHTSNGSDKDRRKLQIPFAVAGSSWASVGWSSGLRYRSDLTTALPGAESFLCTRPVMGNCDCGGSGDEHCQEAARLLGSILKMRKWEQESLAKLARRGTSPPPPPVCSKCQVRPGRTLSSWDRRDEETSGPGNQEDDRAQTPTSTVLHLVCFWDPTDKSVDLDFQGLCVCHLLLLWGKRVRFRGDLCTESC